MTAIAYSYIRFSTTEQQKGDSLRRQLEKSQAYAAEHGLVLDETLNMRDLGVSAFRKANVERGNLGAFLQAIEKGLVKPGSYLIVESLDRLSRAEVVDALEIFLTILRHEIIIVTLADRRTYSRETVRNNYSELIVSIAVMARSHDESLTKSVRRTASWERAKKLAAESGKKITRKIPFWLALPDLDGEFIVKEAEVAVVRRIFSLAQAGFGHWKICQELNRDGVKPPAAHSSQIESPSQRGWGTSSVAHVLQSEAVIGNLVVGGKTDSPQVIQGYYPRIIDDALYYEVQPKGREKGGRSSPLKTNLFTHLIYCGYCGGPMQVDTCTKGGVRRSSMLCQNGRRGFGCTARAWAYEKFERSFFSFVREVDLSTLIGLEQKDSSLQDQVTILRGQVEKNEQRISRLLLAIEEGGQTEMLVKRLRERESEQIDLEKRLKEKLLELDRYLNSDRRMTEGIQSATALYERMAELSGEDRVMLRYAIAESIASVVKSITVFTNGSGIRIHSALQDEPHEQRHTKSFAVNFQNGLSRFVTPESNYSGVLRLKKVSAP